MRPNNKHIPPFSASCAKQTPSSVHSPWVGCGSAAPFGPWIQCWRGWRCFARSGKGARWVRREVSRAGSPVAAWHDWAQGHPFKAAATWDRAQRQHQSIQRLGAHVVTFNDLRYPALLAHILDAPPVLYARGTWPKPEGWGRALAVVGTRGCSPQGAAWALQAGREWTEAGGRLVSGLARGIDGRAHQGALNGARGGAQVAVLPCALTPFIRACTKGLPKLSGLRGGLLLTEQPPGAQGGAVDVCFAESHPDGVGADHGGHPAPHVGGR